MANKNIKKKTFKDFKKEYSEIAKYKPLQYLDLGHVFYEACGVPGPALGHINMFLGHSDTGKTTALIKAAVDAQKKGIVPVLLITEQKFDFEQAKRLGFECTIDENDEYEGFFIFNNNFKYIEQVTDYIYKLLKAQEKGEIENDLLFLWDSIGSVPCKMTYEGKGGKQHNASVLSDKIGMGLNQVITGSRRMDSKNTNTLLIVNQPWVDLPTNMYGQPKIKAKGGNAAWLNSSLVFLFGNQRDAGISKLKPIERKGRKISLGIRSKVSILKNHINGLGFDDGKIIMTAHGFHKGLKPEDETEFKKDYVKDHMDYISLIFEEKITDVDQINFESVE